MYPHTHLRARAHTHTHTHTCTHTQTRPSDPETQVSHEGRFRLNSSHLQTLLAVSMIDAHVTAQCRLHALFASRCVIARPIKANGAGQKAQGQQGQRPSWRLQRRSRRGVCWNTSSVFAGTCRQVCRGGVESPERQGQGDERTRKEGGGEH